MRKKENKKEVYWELKCGGCMFKEVEIFNYESK